MVLSILHQTHQDNDRTQQQHSLHTVLPSDQKPQSKPTQTTSAHHKPPRHYLHSAPFCTLPSHAISATSHAPCAGSVESLRSSDSHKGFAPISGEDCSYPAWAPPAPWTPTWDTRTAGCSPPLPRTRPGCRRSPPPGTGHRPSRGWKVPDRKSTRLNPRH